MRSIFKTGQRPGAHRALATTVAMVSLIGCSRPSASAVAMLDGGASTGTLSADEAAKVLAHVGDRTITLGDYVASLQHMDEFDRIRYSAPARRRELLDEMIDVMLLAGEARDQGYDKEPAAQQEAREILRDAVLKTAREGAPTPSEVPAAEVQQYFEAHNVEFHDPERRRVSAIVVATAATARATLEAAMKATPSQWGDLVRTRSLDPKAKSDVPLDLAGDLGFVAPPGDTRGANVLVPDEVRAAVFEIANVGDVLPRIVPAGGKFYIVRLQSKTSPRDLMLQDAERSIRVRISQEKARALEEAFLGQLRKQYPVEIDEAALAKVKVDVPSGDAGAQVGTP